MSNVVFCVGRVKVRELPIAPSPFPLHHHLFLSAIYAHAISCRISNCSSTSCACLSRNCTSPSDSSRLSTRPLSRLSFASTAISTPSWLTAHLVPLFYHTTPKEAINNSFHRVYTSSCRSAALAASARPTRPTTQTLVSVPRHSVHLQQTLVSQESCPFLSLQWSAGATWRQPRRLFERALAHDFTASADFCLSSIRLWTIHHHWVRTAACCWLESVWSFCHWRRFWRYVQYPAYLDRSLLPRVLQPCLMIRCSLLFARLLTVMILRLWCIQ